ncbi:glutathione S-transferase family protein [Sphingomonas immobilis]|uniref:Glutathione S-transferase n=1 Tax=Sphingomonas immobilis TaxID=3063997 RepID=A0ABT8ZZA5_9SPHN|nr:glutathione S-transferase [Sphingomonas sp. CA1-15]MDO7842522.1 glutathione S-transferase [Sphingomonas sp. CA1-15]
MAELTFYTNPQSRGQIIRWMLEEVGAPYETVVLDYATTLKGAEYLAINPMGKVPAIVHDGKVVTECAAICAYLADAFPEAGLAPPVNDRAEYYRWLFFAAGPVEAAFTNKALKVEVSPEQQRMVGYGTFETAIHAVEKMLEGRAYVTGSFSAADLYLGSELGFMMRFGMLQAGPATTAYVERLTSRDAYKRAAEIDAAAAKELAPAE